MNTFSGEYPADWKFIRYLSCSFQSCHMIIQYFLCKEKYQ